MKQNELMIHNYVSFDDFPVEITNIGLTHIEGHLNKYDTLYGVRLKLEHINPIPITEELLLKNGFERTDTGWFKIYIGDCTLFIKNLLGIREDLKTDLWRVDLSGKIGSHFLNKGILETNALHQLQNLCNIAGVEMEWKV